MGMLLRRHYLRVEIREVALETEPPKTEEVIEIKEETKTPPKAVKRTKK